MSHVALVIPGLDRIGGAERQVMLLAKGLRLRNWRVSVVALSGAGGDAAAELTSAGVEFLTLEMRKGLADPRGWIRFHHWINRERPDVIHAHLPHAAWLSRWSRLFSPFLGLSRPALPSPHLPSPSLTAPTRSSPVIPAIIDTLHSSHCGTCFRRLAYRSSDWLADCVTAVSQSVAQTHLAAGMVSRDKLSVLPNGVDVDDFSPDASARVAMRRQLALSNEFLWFAAGRLEPVKDYPTLLKAFASVPTPAQLFIAGQGPLQQELHALSASLGLERRVHFLGFQSDVKQWMHAADAFVLSSKWEGLPIGLLEAGACALPSVATDVPGSREVIVNGRTGWLTPPGDHTTLAQTMTALMQSSPEERRTMGNLARQHITEQFGLGSVLDRWERLYAELLQRSCQRAPQLDHPVAV